LSHVDEIRTYLETRAPMIPNAIVIAFDSSVHFEAGPPSPLTCSYARAGILVIPINDRVRDENKPGFIVDGQQRLAAIREAAIDSFPICVTAFITRDIRQQTSSSFW